MTSSHHLIGFGASTMAGAGDDRGGIIGRLQLLGLPYAGFHNLGIGGDTTREMLARCDAAKAWPDREVVVVLGCNDVPRDNDSNPARRTTLDEYRANLAAIFTALAGRRNIFGTSFRVDPVRTGVQPPVFAAYMQAATDTARSAGWRVVDCCQLTRDRIPALWAPDGMHAAPPGHAVLADLMAGALSS